MLGEKAVTTGLVLKLHGADAFNRSARHAAQSCDRRVVLLPGISQTTRAGFFKALEWAVLAVPERTALPNGLVKQSVRERRGHQDADGHGAGGFAEQGDVVGVAAKAGNVGLDPAQRRQLILQAVIAR